MSSYQVEKDLEENHGRQISRNRIQQISEKVSSIIEQKESEWSYALPEKVSQTKIVGFSMDGTTTNMKGEGWREVMSGTISFYDGQGNRLHTVYVGQSPEYGKETFKKRMSGEIAKVKTLFPELTYVGLADGAVDNWKYLTLKVDYSILDFWHATEYLALVSKIASRSKCEQEEWLNKSRHRLRYESGAVASILVEIREFRKKQISEKKRNDLEKVITYFENHMHQMAYANYANQNLPIGSGVVEAACKVLVKQRSCNSGMRWREKGLQNVLNIRGLLLTEGRWNQFWDHVDQFGKAA